MAIPIIALAGTCIAVAPLLLLNLRCTKPGTVRYLGFAVAVSLFGLLFQFAFQFLLAQTTNQGTNVNPADVPYFTVPSNATNVSYTSQHGPTALIAEFCLDKDAFLKWMDENERSIQPIDSRGRSA